MAHFHARENELPDLHGIDTGRGGHLERLAVDGPLLRALLSRLDAPSVSFRFCSFPDRASFHPVVATPVTYIFDGAVFGDHTRFTAVRFDERTRFFGARFGSETRFDGAAFSGGVSFYKARFVGGCNFDGATFGGDTVFEEAVFGTRTSFYRADFAGPVRFTAAKFGARVTFERCVFHEAARFDRASLGDDCSFTRATFSGEFRADRATIGARASLLRCEFIGGARLSRTSLGAECCFDEALFGSGTYFDDDTIGPEASFRAATFGDEVTLRKVVFAAGTDLEGVTIGSDSRITGCEFRGEVSATGIRFGDDAIIEATTVAGSLRMSHATIGDRFRLVGVEVGQGLALERATFGDDLEIAALTVAGHAGFDHAVLGLRPTFELRAGELRWRNVRHSEAIAIRLHGGVVMDDTVLTVPMSILAVGPDRPAEVTSLMRSTLEAPLILAEHVSLRRCRFRGASGLSNVHLQQSYADFPVRHGRRLIADELDWWSGVYEALARGRLTRILWWPVIRSRLPACLAHPPTRWVARRSRSAGVTEQLRDVYRQLRVALETSMDIPGAADFYFGEMEMRRHSPGRLSTRVILSTYWLISGYGLRAWRSAVSYLAVIVGATALFEFGRRTFVDAKVCHTSYPCESSFSSCWSTLIFFVRSSLSLLRDNEAEGITASGELVLLILRIVGPILLALTLLGIRSRVERR